MIGVILGTGPSLTQSADSVRKLQSEGALIFGPNNTFRDFDLDVWLACDPLWHEVYGNVTGPFDKWHWSRDICHTGGYRFIEGVWVDGLWLKDRTRISLNHCSGAQLLNLAVHYDCDPILLVGHDFHYDGPKRHYFDDLSDVPGEYPLKLRKWSEFDKRGRGDDLLAVYKRIADQKGRPEIINCTPNSRLPWFPMRGLNDFCA